MRFLALFLALFLIGLTIPVFGELYVNEEYGISIEYPDGWNVENESIVYDENLGYDEGSVSVEFFYVGNDPENADISLEIIWIKNDVYVMNYEDQDYIDRLSLQISEGCIFSNFDIDGRTCSNEKIISIETLEIDNISALKTIAEFTMYYDQNKPQISIDIIDYWVDIIINDDVWLLHYSSLINEHDENEINKMIKSFKFIEKKEKLIPGVRDNTFDIVVAITLMIITGIVLFLWDRYKKLKQQKIKDRICYRGGNGNSKY